MNHSPHAPSPVPLLLLTGFLGSGKTTLLRRWLTQDPHPPRQLEPKQSMKDVALTRDPETGQPVRRLVQAGYLNTQRWTKSPSSPKPAASSPGGGSCCGVSSCGPH